MAGFNPLNLKNYNKNKNTNAKPQEKSKISGTSGGNTKKPPVQYKEYATAPYNFVDMTEAVLPAPLQAYCGDYLKPEDEKECCAKFKEYIIKEGKYSGSIELALENLTPLFIGSDTEKFFCSAARPVIPGSSLRGLVRSLFKIVTAGAMRPDEDFVDRHLYFRQLMAPASIMKELNEAYIERMTTERKVPDGESGQEKTIPVKKAKPGFLVRYKEAGEYAIIPCRSERRDKKEYLGDRSKKNSCVIWMDKDKGAYIYTGNQKEKEKIFYLSEMDWNKEIRVPERVISEYRDDKSRGGVDLLDEKGSNVKRGGAAEIFADDNRIDRIAPCFYIVENGEIVSFGHGRSYRIPYRKSVGDRVPQVLQSSKIDFSDAVFGSKEHWAGRVAFEDAQLVNEVKTAGCGYVKPLLGAKPTSYQLYLKQYTDPTAHWDSKNAGSIRGYKQYWHQKINNSDWQDGNIQEHKNVTKKIEPLAAGRKFTGKIHFHNLSAVELGALCKVFCLGGPNQDIVYKLGMGKSLGMGSVRIHAKLYLEAAQRYAHLFGEEGWLQNQMITPMEEYIKAFDTYANNELGKEITSYATSIRELEIMLDYNNTKLSGWAEKVASMSGDTKKGVDQRYIKKVPLKKLQDVVKDK